MPDIEKTYFRIKLGTEWSSSRLATSYLEGRIERDELFVSEGKQFSFIELYLQDQLVQEILRANGKQGDLFPAQEKFGLIKRMALYREVVLRGEDRLAYYLAKEIEQKTEIERLQNEISSIKRQLCCWKKNNEDLVTACQNVLPAVQEIKQITEAQRERLDAQSEMSIRYSTILSILGGVTNEFCKKLQTNIVPILVSEDVVDPKSLTEIKVIDQFRETTLSEMDSTRRLQAMTLARKREEFERESERKLAELTKWVEGQKRLCEEDCANSRKDIQTAEDELSKQKANLEAREQKLKAEYAKIREEVFMEAKEELLASLEKESADTIAELKRQHKAEVEKIIAEYDKKLAEVERRILDANQRQADAEKRASDALKRQADAEKRASDALKRQADAERRILDVNQRVADAERRALLASKKHAEAMRKASMVSEELEYVKERLAATEKTMVDNAALFHFDRNTLQRLLQDAADGLGKKKEQLQLGYTHLKADLAKNTDTKLKKTVKTLQKAPGFLSEWISRK